VLQRTSAGRVLAAFPTALYVQVGSVQVGSVQVGSATGLEVVAVVTSDGLRLPLAAVLPDLSTSAPFAVHRAGDAVDVLDGGLQVGPVRYLPGRWWSPRRALPGPPHPPTVHELADLLAAAAPAHDRAVERALAGATEELRTALVSGHSSRALSAADSLLGLGPGLTPSGDDLLAGLLATCSWLQDDPCAAALGRQVVSRAALRTTALSAALLRCAAEGAAAGPVVDLVDAVAGRRPLGPALRGLLAVGSTSGHDTARGVQLAAEVLLHRSPGSSPAGGTPTEEDL
jgi:hypothetical protein